MLHHLTFNSDGLPVWTRMNLPQAPDSKLGANVGAVGPFMFQHGGVDADATASDTNSNTDSDSTSSTAAPDSGASTSGGLHALCTFTQDLVLTQVDRPVKHQPAGGHPRALRLGCGRYENVDARGRAQPCCRWP
jgi:hypothetical protein